VFSKIKGALMLKIDWELIERLSVMPKARLMALHKQALGVAHLSGDVAEVGVYRGGSALLLAQTLPHKRLHTFESFVGLQNLSHNDLVRRNPMERGHAAGDFALEATARIQTKEMLAAAGVLLYEGSFKEQQERVAGSTFCFAHFDADTYTSTREFLEFFYPRLVKGGKLMFDDVGWPATVGVEKALIEFFGAPTAYTLLGNYQAVVVK